MRENNNLPLLNVGIECHVDGILVPNDIYPTLDNNGLINEVPNNSFRIATIENVPTSYENVEVEVYITEINEYDIEDIQKVLFSPTQVEPETDKTEVDEKTESEDETEKIIHKESE